MNLQTFLLEEGKIKASTLKYYLKWIKNYKSYQCNDEQFHKSIHSVYQDWQINQAFNALLFSFRNVLHQTVADLDGVLRGKNNRKLPVVLEKSEISSILRSVHLNQFSPQNLLS